MKKKNVIIISIVVAVLIIIALAVGCSVKKDTASESAGKAAVSSESEEQTDESSAKDTSTGKDEEAKNSDGSELTTEEKTPVSSAVSNKDKVQPKTTAKPTQGNNTGSTNTGNSSSSTGNGSNTGNSGSGSGSGGGEPAAHTHTWVNVTKTVDHPAKTHEEDVYEDQQVCIQDAWDEQVAYSVGSECGQCEYRTTNADDMGMHCLENGHSSHIAYEYKNVHHDAVYETQRVKTGTKTLTDQAAWTEEFVTGRRCSSCGKTEIY